MPELITMTPRILYNVHMIGSLMTLPKGSGGVHGGGGIGARGLLYDVTLLAFW